MDCYDLHPDRVAHVLREVERQLRYQRRLCQRLQAQGIGVTDTLYGHARDAAEVLERQSLHLRKLCQRHHVDGEDGHPSRWQDPAPKAKYQSRQAGG